MQTIGDDKEISTICPSVKFRCKVPKIKSWSGAVVVAQLVMRSLPMPEVRGLNTVIGKLSYQTFISFLSTVNYRVIIFGCEIHKTNSSILEPELWLTKIAVVKYSFMTVRIAGWQLKQNCSYCVQNVVKVLKNKKYVIKII